MLRVIFSKLKNFASVATLVAFGGFYFHFSFFMLRIEKYLYDLQKYFMFSPKFSNIMKKLCTRAMTDEITFLLSDLTSLFVIRGQKEGGLHLRP